MKRQIPLHKPQILPVEWGRLLINADAIPTEEQISPMNESKTSEEFYECTSGASTRALICAVMHAFSTISIPEIKHDCYGDYSTIFCIRFPDGFRIAARLPNRKALHLARVASTAAMMTMARCYSGIPAPEVYAWNPEIDNPVGAPYILMEWVDGIEPCQKWYKLPHEERTQLMEDLAAHHAKFAKPLPFRGIGNLYFVESSSEQDEGDPPFNDASAYRLGPITPGTECSHERSVIRTWPPTTPESLRDFWLERWQWEVDWITETFGEDRSAAIKDSPLNGRFELDPFTVGDMLDAARALLTLIQTCILPPSSQVGLYEPCFVATNYTFKNIKIDPTTNKITTFLDWDNVYVSPFLLCSRYPDEMCYRKLYGNDTEWRKTGCFEFFPVDEGGEIESDFVIDDTDESSMDEDPPEKAGDESPPALVSDDGSDSDEASGDHMEEDSDEEAEEDIDIDALFKFGVRTFQGGHPLKDTLLRRQYEQLLIKYDARFGIDGFWEMRKDPVTIQHLVMKGWVVWLYKDYWLEARVARLQGE